MKYGEINFDTTGIRDIERDGGLPAEELAKLVTPEYALNQCGELKKREGENEHE